MIKDKFDKFFLFFNTIKYLKISQIYGRIRTQIFKGKVRERLYRVIPERNARFVNIVLYDEKITNGLHATFLNHTEKLTFPINWNISSVSKLWLYNLNYFEDLVAENCDKKNILHLKILDSWQSENSEGSENSWEPYTISLRVVNILKAWHAGLPLEKRHFESLYAQCSFLEGSLEKHLLGNHYFVNLKALLFAGVIFENQHWIDTAVIALKRELPEQILDDGAHFELSPMYHALILVDILDMYNLCTAYTNQTLCPLADNLRDHIPKMLQFLALMLHNDEGVSFFNDSVNGIAPSKTRIVSYANMLGYHFPNFNPALLQVVDAEPSGYMIASNNNNKIIFDAAEIGPSYLPAHGHADTLSFEFSIGKERVFVNSGVSEYGNSEDRLRQRQTKSHNTVEINNQDSSQVWSSFRVAKRANPIRRIACRKQDSIFLSASHNGYKKIYGGPIHSRSITLESQQLTIDDKLEGNYDLATLRFYFHPDLEVIRDENEFKIIGKNFIMSSQASDCRSRLIKSNWHPEFGKTIPNIGIEYQLIADSIKTVFTWETM